MSIGAFVVLVLLLTVASVVAGAHCEQVLYAGANAEGSSCGTPRSPAAPTKRS